MASTVPLARDFAAFEAAARALDTTDESEAWETLDAEFGFMDGSPEAASADPGPHARRLHDLLEALTTARSLVHGFLRDGGDTEAARLADLERRVRDLLERVRTARERMGGQGGRSHP
jgi:hypothetical protein